VYTRRTSTYLLNLPVSTTAVQLYVPVLVRAGTAVLQLCTQPYVHEQCVIVAVTVPLFIYIKSSKILQEVRGRVLNNSVEG
jgi:hypothetical protein